jgi:beta-1,4-N-acetylglucosaminyltransferase
MSNARKENRTFQWLNSTNDLRVNTERLPAAYILWVLGSGGHTAELCELIKSTTKEQPNLHRRYVITSGDTSSISVVEKTELQIHEAFSFDDRAGTFDCIQIPRARRVHQPLYTAILTTIRSALRIVDVLTREPECRRTGKFGGDYRYPHVIVTNGPGTGFVVCGVAYLLKLVRFAPSNCLKMVYVESWARSETLSLTGKLFHWTGLADLFLVQQESLAKKYAKQYISVFKASIPCLSREVNGINSADGQ